ncbi:hypothetical protein U0070_015672 [Myodes glareolus]|uniref:G-protein coupled receptors family 1 profile domain-containing protein n=1 Tax=Myodes glareolus TaxID=447135 RepID=A0AAW0H580_MYOGA
MISDLLKERKVISFYNCMTQICFIHTMGAGEMVLLIAMAFDRYTATCKPLHYLSIMSPKICILFVIAAWVTGVIHALSQFSFVISLPFCGPNKVDSFYCDFPRIIQLACTDGDKFEFVVAANSGFMSMGTFFLLLLSMYLLPGMYPEGHEKSTAAHSQNSSRPLIPAIHISSSPCFDTHALTPDFCQLVAGPASWDIQDAYPPQLPLEAGRRFSPGGNIRVRGVQNTDATWES